MKRLVVIALVSCGLLSGCGGGGNGGDDGGQVRVVVSPLTASVIAGQTQQFNVTVTGALNSAVTWSVSCSTSTCGSIDGNGLYSAPALILSDVSVTVRATSQEDRNISATASINQMPVSITVSPSTSATLISGDTKQFSVTVTNAPSGHSGYTWAVTGVGSITVGGLYSAPAKVSTDSAVTVTATSEFDTAKTASVSLNLKAPVIVLSPGNMTLDGGGQVQFTPTVSYVPAGQNGVTWQLTGAGSIAAGMYHAPALVSAHQTATIRCVSSFDNSKVAQSVVTMDPVTVAVTPESVTTYPAETHEFSATVAHHVNEAVTWSLSGTSCGGAACGTIDDDGVYTAPLSIANEVSATVRATSVADPSKSDTAALTLKPVTVTLTPETASVKTGTSQQFSASVQGGSNSGVTWSLSGTGCSGSACGTISTSGLYTAPGVVPVPPAVTVKATAVADATRFDTASVTVIHDPNVKLNGAYAFIYTGWDMSSRSLDAVGSFTADGNGHLNGLIDVNGVNTAYRNINQAFSGTYQMNAADNRGQMVFNLPTGTRTFRFTVDSSGEKGHFILFESTGRYGSGMFKRQTTSDFSLAKLNGDYAMGMVGLSASGDERNGVLGRMHIDGTGHLSNTSLDITNSNGPADNVSFTGSIAMNSGSGMAFGRGTLAVSTIATNANFSFYLVDDDEAYMIRTDVIGDDVPPLVGGFMKQVGGPFTAASFSGRSVFYLTGLVLQTVRKAGVTVGEFNVTNGAGSAQYTWNVGGSVYSGSTGVSATVSTNGRGLLGSAVLGPHVFYLVGPNTGFIMKFENPGTSVNFGFFEAQSAGPFSNASLNGEYFGGAIAPATGSVGYGHGFQTYNGNGAWSGTGDTASPEGGLSPDTPVSGTYVITDAATGAFNWQLTVPGIYNKKFYVINQDKIVFVPTESSNTQPVAEIFEK